LPFEAKWFKQQGCNATFVGHPFFDEVRRHQLDERFLSEQRKSQQPLVSILPGSRTQEVTHNLPFFLEAAGLIQAQIPRVRFAIACFKASQAHIARKMVAERGLAIDVHVRRTPELISAADCCMAVSGSVSLELLYHTKPTVILYWINPLAYRVQKYFRRVKYISLVNLFRADELFPQDLTPYDPHAADADKVLYPEYLTCEDKSLQIAIHIVSWLTDAPQRQRIVEELAALKTKVAHGGASSTAAAYICDVLGKRVSKVQRPHFLPPEAPARVSQPNVVSTAA